MKKVAIASLLVTALIVYFGFRMLNEIDPAMREDQGVTASELEKEFTEGVWIKKYPGNNACFKLETREGFKIVCDPYLITELLKPDIVLESHQHMDHMDPTNLEQPFYLIKEPEEYKTDDAMITGFPGKHNKGDKEDTNYIYVVKMEDITIAHFASQGEVPSDEILKQIGPVDILLIQVFNDPSYDKLIIEEAGTIISKLKPKIIIPEHGDATMGSQLAKYYNIAEEIEASGSIIITRAMLEETKNIRIINLDN
jgi:hypothetical protein